MMNRKFAGRTLRNVLFSAALLTVFTAANLHANILATATFTSTQLGPTSYQYDLTLNDTGTTTIGTFWFSWIPGNGFLTAPPTGIVSPTGWSDIVTNAGKAIQWVTTVNLLAPGNEISGFMFDSTMTPNQLLGPSVAVPADPVSTYFVYIAAPLGDPGFQGAATEVAPEPSSLLLLAIGMGLLVLRRRASR